MKMPFRTIDTSIIFRRNESKLLVFDPEKEIPSRALKI
jgi:hypothetical protein